MDDDKLKQNINEADTEYVIISKTKNDILDELDFENEEDRLLCDNIISNLEKMAAENIRNMKTVNIPNIGCIRINPVKRKFRDSKLHLAAIRKNLNKEEYKEYVKDYIVDLKEKQIEIDKYKVIINRIKRNNKIKYDKYYKQLGKEYAELFIFSLSWLEEVPFDLEWEKQYQSLKD